MILKAVRCSWRYMERV